MGRICFSRSRKSQRLSVIREAKQNRPAGPGKQSDLTITKGGEDYVDKGTI